MLGMGKAVPTRLKSLFERHPGAFTSIAGPLVLFGSDDQYVYAFDLSLRSLAWKLKVKGKVKLAPAVGKGMAFIANDEGVYAVELN